MPARLADRMVIHHQVLSAERDLNLVSFVQCPDSFLDRSFDGKKPGLQVTRVDLDHAPGDLLNGSDEHPFTWQQHQMVCERRGRSLGKRSPLRDHGGRSNEQPAEQQRHEQAANSSHTNPLMVHTTPPHNRSFL